MPAPTKPKAATAAAPPPKMSISAVKNSASTPAVSSPLSKKANGHANGNGNGTAAPAAAPAPRNTGTGPSASLGPASVAARPLLDAVLSASDAAACAEAASELCAYINSVPLRQALQADGISAVLLLAANNKKFSSERESAAIALEAIAYQCGGKNAAPFPLGAEPWLLHDFLVVLLDLHADKADVVREAAEKATSALWSLPPPEAAKDVLEMLYAVLKDSATKWQSKVGALKLISKLSQAASDQVGAVLEDLIPVLTNAMHETKADISKQAVKTATKVCQNTLENNDLRPFIPDLVGCMLQPDTVPECIKKLSSCTFVAEVTGPALAVMVPLLTRALNERNQTVQRSTVIVVENLTRLVRDPNEASKFLPVLTPGVKRIEEGASFKEVRELARSALDVLEAATKAVANDANNASSAAGAAAYGSGSEARQIALGHLVDVLGAHGLPDARQNAWSMIGLQYVAGLITHIADQRFTHESAWNDCYVLPYVRRLLHNSEAAGRATEQLRKIYIGLDEARFGKEEEEDDDVEGECLCKIQFSLAYGGLLLLNHTWLRMHRGHRYGIVAHNGAGKSTLLKALRDGKVEGYPSQDQVRTIMVEHSLQGEDGSKPILPFVCDSMPEKTSDEVAAALKDVGFDEERQTHPVGSLSGGWKMKLELARAMLQKADVLLLDEPTNHLDVASIAWLEQYLISNSNITVLTVSHDSGFLDNICTDIMHYEQKKIKYYKGNLAAFVAVKPEAQAYYSLAASTVALRFPDPGHLMGVRSNTRTILKLSNVTYTYPSMKKPSIRDASLAISLSTRMGVLGPNGAGKSTLIKCLTGEVVPQEGKVEKHPALRVAMMAQHAFHHLEQHLEKTPCQYIMWRYHDGHDREISEKATRKLTDEEEQQMQVPITSTTGEKRRIEFIVGRSKLKKSFQYEIKWMGLMHKHNTWIPRERLVELGFNKMLQNFDDYENSREGAGQRDLTPKKISLILQDMGLDASFAEHHEIGGLSGGQRVKVCLAGALCNAPHVLVLDEPTNYLDRDSLAGLTIALKEWKGAVIVISHNTEFIESLHPDILTVDGGQIISKVKLNGQPAAMDDLTGSVGPDSGFATPAGGLTPAMPGTPAGGSSKAGTPLTSATQTPAGSGDEGEGGADGDSMTKFKAGKGKKKKMTRNEKKAQEERRRLRLTNWLNFGGEREPDTDDD